MDEHRATRRRLLIGTAITSALLAAGVLIFVLEDIRRATAATYEIVVLFDQATALREGAAVRIAGRPLGTVTEVDVLDRPADSPERIAVTVELPAEVHPHVRRSSRARLIRLGLGGDAIVSIEPGPPASPPLDPGDTLVAVRPVEGDRLARQAGEVVRAWDSLAASVAVLREAAEETGPELERALDEVRTVGIELDRSRERYRAGPLGAMLRDPSWRSTIEHLRRAAAAVRDGFDRVGAGTGGTADDALAEGGADLGGAIARMLGRADTLRARLARLEERMRLRGGLPSRLATDTALQAALRGVRAQLDSLIAEARANPFRFVF